MRTKETETKGLEVEPGKISIWNLVIEVTRRCNMSCTHCLRGDAECLNMNMRHVNQLFSKIDHIDNLTFTGGEPGLVPHIINKIIDSAHRHNVEVSSFYIATNAKKTTRSFVNTLLRLYVEFNSEYDDNVANWDENSICAVQYSNDAYHDDCEREGFGLLRSLRFVTPKNKENGATYALIDQGNASFYHACHGRVLKPDSFDIDITTGYATIQEGTLYLNCNGWLISGCDWSYENQDDEEHDCRVCRVKDFTIERLREWENEKCL